VKTPRNEEREDGNSQDAHQIEKTGNSAAKLDEESLH
jgi:hypothetical protein